MSEITFSLYPSAGTPRKLTDITTGELLAAVQSGGFGNRNFAGLVTTIRNTSDKKERDKLKANLPAVTLSGIFPAESRTETEILQHSGLMQVDFDEVSDPVEMFTQLARDPYTFLCFISPSGTGVKGVVKIPIIAADFEQTAADHRRSFHALQLYYKSTYSVNMDRKCKDMSRLLYLSHDTTPYYNEAAELFTDKKDEPRKKQKTAPAAIDNEFPGSVLILPDQREDVEHVVNQITANRIDITGTYEDWLSIAFALSSAFGESGRQYFHDVSQFYAGYDPADADKQYSEASKQRTNGKLPVTLKTFFYHAKQYGISISKPRSRSHKPTSSTPPAQQPEAVQPPADEPASPGTDRPKPTAALEQLKTPIPQECADENGYFLQEHQFYYTGSCYYVGLKSEQRISNFIMEFLYFFPDGTNNAKRLIKLQNKHGHIELIELFAKELTSLSAFKAAVSSKGNFFFSGMQPALDRIIEYHISDATTAETINVLGWQPERAIYAFSNGIINGAGDFVPVNDLGIVHDSGNSYFMPALSPLNGTANNFSNEARFLYKCGTINFERYAYLMYQAYGDNAAVSVAFAVAAIYRDIIFASLSMFPFLYLFSEPGAGKTSFTDLHLSLFGKPQTGISLSGESTDKSLPRKLSQLYNAMIYLKEYTNNIPSNKIGTLKTAWEGVGYDRAQTSNDNRTHQTGVYSALMIDGNELPEKNSALFSRCIILDFRAAGFTDQQVAAFRELKEAAAEGLGQVLAEIHSHRAKITDGFTGAYHTTLQWIKDRQPEYGEMAERTMVHMAVLITPIRVLHDVLPFCMEWEKLAEILIVVSTKQTVAMQQTNEVQNFFTVLEFLSSEHKIYEGKHYRFIQEYGGRTIVALAFARIYPLYVEHSRKQGAEATARISLLTMLKGKSYFIPAKGAKPGDTHSDAVLQTSCFRFEYEPLNISLERVAGLPAYE